MDQLDRFFINVQDQNIGANFLFSSQPFENVTALRRQFVKY